MSIQNNESLAKAPWIGWRIGQKLWTACSTKQALLLTLIPIALAWVASYLIPQMPAGLRADEFKVQDWLAVRAVQFRAWTPFLTAIGAFYVQETLWFRVLLTLAAFVLLVALGDTARRLAVPPTVQQPTSFYEDEGAETLSTALTLDQALQVVRQVLPRPRVQADQGNSYLYAGRHTWARSSAMLGLLGLWVLVIGLAIQARWGWRQSDIQIFPYKSVSLGQGGDLELQLLDLSTITANGQSAPTARLQIDGQIVRPIQLDTPLRHRGYRYLWTSEGGPSVRLSAYRTASPEQPLTLYEYTALPQPALSLQYNFAPGQQADLQFILSEDKVVGLIHWNQSGSSQDDDSPQFHLWALGQDGEELGLTAFELADPAQGPQVLQAELAGVRYRLEVAQYILLDIAHRPGQWLFWVGGILLVLGGLGSLVPQQQIWVRVQSAGKATSIQILELPQGLLRRQQERPSRVLARLCDVLNSQDDTTSGQPSDLTARQDHTTT